MIKKISIISLILLLICSLLASSFAWFTLFADVEFPPSSATAEASAYFESGDGSAEDPYVLSDKIHVYNLAWLQYIGYFNGADVSNGLAQSYFVLKNDIDMEGMTIPPIGTTQYPFIGNFDGQEYVISNLTTANAETAFSLKPGTAEFKATDDLLSEYGGAAAEVGNVMGFFGVVGAYGDGDVEAMANNTVKNFGLTNYTLTSNSQTTTVGFVAGYVNAPVENVIVGSCKLNTPNATEGKENADFTSEYALIGYSTDPENLTENSVTLYDPTITTETLGAGSGGADTGGAGVFGDSMDMVELIQRLTYMYTENISKLENGSKLLDTPSPYPVSFYPSGYRSGTGITEANKKSGAVNYKSTTAFTTPMLKNTVLALNVDANTMFKTESNYKNPTGTIIPSYDSWQTEYYKSNSSETIKSNNTGYIVSGGTSDSTAWIRARMQPIKGSTNNGITNSLPSNDSVVTYTEKTDGTYETNLTLYTVDKNGTNGTIDTDSNSFKRYNSVVKNFAKSMAANTKENTEAKTMISGIRFFSTATRGITIDSNGKVTSGTTTKTVSLYDVEKTNYEMIDGAINFSLSGAGYITAIAGTYANSTTGTDGHSLFTLYQVTRDASNAITKVEKIENIWTKTSGNDIAAIVYNVVADDEANYTADGYVCAFHSENMNKLTTKGAAYYFEIPVLAGDYAIGGSYGEAYGAYLMYLDIGSNGGFGLGGSTNPTTVISEYIEESQNTYEYVSGVTVAETDADGNITNNTPMGSVALQIAGNNQNEITVSRTGNAVSVSGGNLTMLGAGLTSAENAIPAPTSSTTAVIRRRRYIHSDGAEVIVTRTGEDDLTVTVTAKDSSGNDIDITENITTGGVTTIKTAQRTYTITWADIAKPSAGSVLAYRYSSASETVVMNSFTLGEDGKSGTYTVTVTSSADTTVTVDTMTATETVTSATINGTAAATGAEIAVSATQSP